MLAIRYVQFAPNTQMYNTQLLQQRWLKMCQWEIYKISYFERHAVTSAQRLVSFVAELYMNIHSPAHTHGAGPALHSGLSNATPTMLGHIAQAINGV